MYLQRGAACACKDKIVTWIQKSYIGAVESNYVSNMFLFNDP